MSRSSSGLIEKRPAFYASSIRQLAADVVVVYVVARQRSLSACQQGFERLARLALSKIRSAVTHFASPLRVM
jgi:hypothetical protein